MIKIVLLASVPFLCFTLIKPKSAEKSLGLNNYVVNKIDSLNRYYIIYAKKQDSLFKIISKKADGIESCNQIKENGIYNFKLNSLLKNRDIAGKKILPQNSLLVNCFLFDDSTKICIEKESMYDLFFAENLKGLCVER